MLRLVSWESRSLPSIQTCWKNIYRSSTTSSFNQAVWENMMWKSKFGFHFTQRFGVKRKKRVEELHIRVNLSRQFDSSNFPSYYVIGFPSVTMFERFRHPSTDSEHSDCEGWYLRFRIVKTKPYKTEFRSTIQSCWDLIMKRYGFIG